MTGVTYRHPGLLAKTVTTLDVVSSGRAELGIGAAWYEREHRGLGVPFPPTAERFERLEEAIQICLQMWSHDNGPYHGQHYQLDETLCGPMPVSTPRPRILIGGSGERKTFRFVAQYADACNIFGGPDEVAQKVGVLRRHCDAVGRDPNEIEVTAMSEISLRTQRSTTSSRVRKPSPRSACQPWSPGPSAPTLVVGSSRPSVLPCQNSALSNQRALRTSPGTGSARPSPWAGRCWHRGARCAWSIGSPH